MGGHHLGRTSKKIKGHQADLGVEDGFPVGDDEDTLNIVELSSKCEGSNRKTQDIREMYQLLHLEGQKLPMGQHLDHHVHTSIYIKSNP